MGRPWWYDSYWEKNSKPQRKRFRIPRDPIWIWSAVLLLSLLLTLGNGSFHYSLTAWILGFVYTLCRILSVVIIVRSLLSWFRVNPSNPFVELLSQITNPILKPLRRVILRLSIFDISPLVAIVVLYVIQMIIVAILF